MKPPIIVQSNLELKEIIKEQMQLHGDNCDLNHIDVSGITDMSGLFMYSKFNGDISQWDVSNVKEMVGMFSESQFNGDIGQWNVSSVEEMQSMFSFSSFNGDISYWNVNQVKSLRSIFWKSQFAKDLTNWTPYKADLGKKMFRDCPAPIPYWKNYENIEARKSAIDSYVLAKNLKKDLIEKNQNYAKIKI